MRHYFDALAHIYQGRRFTVFSDDSSQRYHGQQAPMRLILLLTLLSLPALYIALPAFEVVFCVLLSAPVLAYLAGQVAPLSLPIYAGALFIPFAILIWLIPRRGRPAKRADYQTELMPLLIFVAGFTVLYQLSLSWSDFIRMGERLRDYAILSSASKNALNIEEPWMSGVGLFYYAYWYRFGAMLGSVLQLPVWETYHILVSFSLAFYLAVIFRIFERHLNFSSIDALFCAVIIALGSNVAGMWAFFNKDTGWWGPSRVISGAINEFPIWSFVLGDLHPHFLNLGLIPFFILLWLSTAAASGQLVLRVPCERLVVYLGLLVIPPLWLKNSNGWEVPIWLLLVGVCLLFAVIDLRARFTVVWRRMSPAARTLFQPRTVMSAGFVLLLIVSLYLSLPYMPSAEGMQIKRVLAPILQSHLTEIMLHWGFALTLLALSTIVLLPGVAWKILGGIFLAGTLLFEEALPFLYMLLMLNCVRVLNGFEFDKPKRRHGSPATALFESIGIAALLLLILPETFFVDDPYGGENERMNTIFKIYAANWFLLHAFAFYLASNAARSLTFSKVGDLVKYTGQAILLICLCGFGWYAASLRMNDVRKDRVRIVEPLSEGLSTVESVFPGSADAIHALRGLPGDVVIEGEGNAYDYTSFVGTLAGKTEFLGWANHVDLLTKMYDERGRREKLIKEFYETDNCQRKIQIMLAKKISYAVFGNLERARYPKALEEKFACLKEYFKKDQYRIYGVP